MLTSSMKKISFCQNIPAKAINAWN